ncbi:hypothetical protein PML78_12320 [Enterococcus dispar]|uniref:hypothetical protein n=1 Tax=Enterococcus dispar TaxID=44009 RepID=UPI00232DDF7A|nr:hypothetical protein [Enterococcus dispar]WCG32960.1 hypothetical protein PML78_12320 [Enterococcus dispar]
MKMQKFINDLDTLLVLCMIAVLGYYNLKVALLFIAGTAVVYAIESWINRKG